jgi:hypothetical protein
MADSLRYRIARFLGGKELARRLASVVAQVNDAPGWLSMTGRPHDYDPSQILEMYTDALTAWRKNPIAWRIIAITTDYVVGDKLRISSSNRSLQKFITEFWHHPKNRVDLRLEAMSDELARAGDLFALLFHNEADGMSYIRFVTKDRIARIQTAENDWETELVYTEMTETGETREWLSPDHPDAEGSSAIMLHYSVNRPLGALLGEGDLTTMLPWLQRYSRMLEDRVRMHWAMRAFLWLVTVPSNKVKEKQEQYRTPPKAGSIIVKDEGEKWEAVNPALHGSDAAPDLKSVRGMIDAGSGYPPHWRGESADANLATATAMQAPTERHLLRRQQYFVFMLEDIVFQAYQRSVQIGGARRLGTSDYHRLFTVSMPDISRADNESLARSAKDLAAAMQAAAAQLPGKSESFNKLLLKLVYRFAGEPQDEELLSKILNESESNRKKTEKAAEEEPAAEQEPEQEGDQNDGGN